MKFSKVLVALALAFSLPACSSKSNSKACSPACEGGAVCVDGTCKILCSGPKDCPTTYVCADRYCEVGGGCGDGVIASGEGCDDHNSITEACSYGLMSCTVCDNTCHLVPGATTYCGDTVVNGSEDCDGGGSDTPACTADCHTCVNAPGTTRLDADSGCIGGCYDDMPITWDGAAGTQQAQGFIPTWDGVLTSVKLPIISPVANSPGNPMEVTIAGPYTNQLDLEGATPDVAGHTLAQQALTVFDDTDAMKEVAFNPPVPVTHGKTYYIIVRMTGASSVAANNPGYWARGPGSVYGGNTFPFGAGFTSSDYGNTWVANNDGGYEPDFAFQTYIESNTDQSIHDLYNDCPSSCTWASATQGNALVQEFTNGQDGWLTAVRVRVQNEAAASNGVKVEVLTDSDGDPTGETVVAQGSVPGSAGSFEWLEVPVGPVPVSASSSLFLSLSLGGSGNAGANTLDWVDIAFAGYSGGVFTCDAAHTSCSALGDEDFEFETVVVGVCL